MADIQHTQKAVHKLSDYRLGQVIGTVTDALTSNPLEAFGQEEASEAVAQAIDEADLDMTVREFLQNLWATYRENIKGAR